MYSFVLFAGLLLSAEASAADLTSGKICAEENGKIVGRCYPGGITGCWGVGPGLALAEKGQAGCPSDQICCKTQQYHDETQGKPEVTSNSSPSGTTARGTYSNQELIPGAGKTSNFVEYIKQIIRFGFAAIGILALFMLSVGAYQYLMAASNLAKIESAKGTIGSALLGLVLGLIAFITLRTINPQLVNLQLSSPGGGAGTTQTGTPGGKGTNYGNGNCVEVSSGPCSPENLASNFGSAANQASIICNYESQGNQMKASTSDICRGDNNGRSFSWGLFQINLTQHNIGGLNCKGAFSGTNSSCTVINESLYQQCVQAAQNPDTNINYAKGLYSRNGWGDWKNTREKCGL